MGIERVIIKNFKKIKDPLVIDFLPGMNILVGDNEAGKTTILEAIHLALTGQYQAKSIRNQISEYLFNREAVVEYLESFQSGGPIQPPEILIEIYFSSGTIPEYEGNGNSKHLDGVEGIQFRIELSEDFYSAYQEMIEDDPPTSLPIEGYIPVWQTFDRIKHLPRQIKYRSALIDSTNVNPTHNSDKYISIIVKDLLDSDDVKAITHAHREMIDSYENNEALSTINSKIESQISTPERIISLTPDRGPKSSWESILVANINGIPFLHSGKGTQCIIQTNLSLKQKKVENAGTILIEEPENHLSHSRLNYLIEMIHSNQNDKQIIISTHSSFVANKLGLENLILLDNSRTVTFRELTPDTYTFFRKLSGYDTLRFLLSNKAILVEGDSDELIIQRAYMDLYNGRLPIMDGIDVIKVGLAFERYLEIATILNSNVAIVTDNDGHPEKLEEKYKKYQGHDNISICYDSNVDTGPVDGFNYNTLEPKLLKANSRGLFNHIFNTNYKDDQALLNYMKSNKTPCALKIFDFDQQISYPNYILDSIKQ